MKTELALNAEELSGIEQSKADTIRKTFEPMAEMVESFEDSYNEIINESVEGITKEVTLKAKKLRIEIGKVRISTEKVRKEQKEEYLRAGKAIDGVSNILKWAINEKENRLKDIENYFEIQEQKRLEELQTSRVEKLSKYIEDAHERNLSDMDEDVWNAYFEAKKKDYQDRIEAEKKAEQERIEKEKAEAHERERIRLENEQLKKEAEEREAELLAEAQEKQKAEEEKKKAIEAELNKGDAAKVGDLLTDLENLKTKYSFKSRNNQKMYSDVSNLIDKIINHIKE